MQRAAINRGITFTSLVKTDFFGVWLADIFSSLCDHDRDYFISPAQTPTSWTTSLFQRQYPANNLNLPENGSVTFSPLAWFIFSSGDFVVCTSSAYRGLFCHTTTDIRPAPVEIPTLFSQASLLLPTLCPLMNFLDCLSLHCSPPVLEAAEGFSHLASLYGCRLTPNSSICMCCHRDWWLKQQRRREGGREGGWWCWCWCRWRKEGAAIKGSQAMTQRFWSAASSGCQPACLCGRQSADSSAPYQTPLLVSARSGYAPFLTRTKKRVSMIGMWAALGATLSL